jgi:hypothetical protein
MEQKLSKMKTLLIILLAVGVSFSASAQKGFRGGRGRPHVVVSVRPYAPFYPYSGFGYGYGYPYYPYGGYGYNARPSKLQMEIQDVRNDYRDKIWSARHDNSISRSERRKTIHELKAERDRTISDLQRNYYKRR